ncbi:copper homeostasis protein cutC homolog [Uranotaenia lowii]|uniref:copper homeostasis protein cutC homolog n=1 Tax=Uranotaenia lowii TaxID=190385 RepID=UPI00247869FB|nr:copper homeostasis protein cutC homolog [Uranotaenia lowii]
MAPLLLEICIDSFESAVAAIRGGANRLELCAALSEGGLTPSVGLLRELRAYLAEQNKSTQVQLYAMIRCRRGSDFRYSEAEMRIMLYDLRLLAENGADGFVFGALDEMGEIHREHCQQVASAAGKLPLTFHRAWDCTDRSKMEPNLQLIASMGYSTVLTSGFERTALKGIEAISQVVQIAKHISEKTGFNLTIMPGSGVTPENARMIAEKSLSSAIHASARSAKNLQLENNDSTNSKISMGGNNEDDLCLMVCNEEIVESIKHALELVC